MTFRGVAPPTPTRSSFPRSCSSGPRFSAWCPSTSSSCSPSPTCTRSPRPHWATSSPAWQGLGYNRRALALQRAAAIILESHGGHVPAGVQELALLPGIGPGTAGAISSFAFNHPAVFIETNIRAVFLHHYSPAAASVPDVDLLPLVEATLDREHPREWYYALMDYGFLLKRSCANPSRASRHHARQAPYEGSNRELRAAVLRELVKAGGRPGLTEAELAGSIPGRPPEHDQQSGCRVATRGFPRHGWKRVRIA